ncbi:MAG: proteasome subunit beta [Candidatus Woesearchaeota archaeon]
MSDDNVMKTGTTTIGVHFNGGVLLAADKRATAGHLIAQKDTEKVNNITPNIAVTMAGTASDAQLLIKLASSELKLKEIRTDQKLYVKEAASFMSRMVYNNLRRPSMMPGISHFIMGGVDETGFYLYDIFPDGTISLCKEYIASGSGSVMAYGVLETLYKKDMTFDEAKELVVKCINAAIRRDSASGNGIDIFLIDKEGARRVHSQDVEPLVTV